MCGACMACHMRGRQLHGVSSLLSTSFGLQEPNSGCQTCPESNLHMEPSWGPRISILMGSFRILSDTFSLGTESPPLSCFYPSSRTSSPRLTLPPCALLESFQLSGHARPVSPNRWGARHKLQPYSRHCAEAPQGERREGAYYLPEQHRQVSGRSKLSWLLLSYWPEGLRASTNPRPPLDTGIRK